MMKKRERTEDRSDDPDKTNPPTLVAELWGWARIFDEDGPPADERDAEGPDHRDAAIELSGNELVTLYWAARDCMIAGAYSGATALLRRLIGRVADERVHDDHSEAEAERLFAVAAALLGRPPDAPPADG
jgi:hypothetical protein